MLRGMIFVDHMNFNIAVSDLYGKSGEKSPYLDYNTVFKGILSSRPNISYTKTTIFAPKPDDFLMQDAYLKGYYKWVQGMRSAKYLDVVEGRYISRPTSPDTEKDILKRESYYKVEKGTDINLAIHALTKAYNNAYDVAFVVSADSDYISLYKQLKNIGKIVIAVAVKGQSLGSIIPEVDDHIILDKDFLNQHIRIPKEKA